MQNLQEAESKLKKYNQEHILTFLNDLEDEEKQELINQILELDFDKMNKLYLDTRSDKKFIQGEITPINCIDKEKIENSEKEKANLLGENIIKNDQYAVVTMAGGQGTRLGFNGPKGTFKLDIGENGKYIFEILTETLKKSKELYGVMPYWYIMTSEDNNDQTISFFEEHDFFGYEKEKVKFFKQGELPLLTMEGKMVIDEKTKMIKTASDGNGSVYSSLQRDNMIDDMKAKGIKWVYISGVDNIMVKPIDPLFIGLTIDKNEPGASKSVIKKYAEERVGAFCKKNGKPGIVEYIELTEDMRNYCNELGDLTYGDANIVSHLLSVDSIEKIASKELKYHAAIKNDLYKFEAFIFDGFEYLDDMLVMRVKRDEEFAPIKNKEGVDSPQTAKEIYERNAF